VPSGKRILRKGRHGVFAGKTVWSMPERFEIYIGYKRRYINTLPFFTVTSKFMDRFYRATLCWYGNAMLAWYMLSLWVHPSICLSVTSRRCTKQDHATRPYDNPGTFIFWSQRSRRNLNRVTPKRHGILLTVLHNSLHKPSHKQVCLALPPFICRTNNVTMLILYTSS